MEIQYDLFIAYHGSYSKTGSIEEAYKLYNYLKERDNSLNIAFFPEMNRDNYKMNIVDVMQSSKFLLVCNENLITTASGSIDHTEHYELCTEIDAFYALTQTGDGRQMIDARVLVTGNYQGREGSERHLHSLFANRRHMFQGQEGLYEGIYAWLCDKRGSAESSYTDTVTSQEIKKVFSRKVVLRNHCNFADLLTRSQKVRVAGISNMEITRVDEIALRYALDHGADIEILFLDPHGTYTTQREHEEGLRPGKIRRLTEDSITDALEFKDTLNEEQKQHFKLFVYDMTPRININMLDDVLILQYYANFTPGKNNPCFLIERQVESPLYDFFVYNFEKIKENSKPIER